MTDVVLVALIAALPPTLVALLALRKGNQNANAIQEVHLSINSRMDELLTAAKDAANAAGRDAERERHGQVGE